MAGSTSNYPISQFLSKTLKDGVALSNTFEVTFDFDGGLQQSLSRAGFNENQAALQSLTVLCEEASLPGMMANTGQTTGVILGEGQINYAHTKSYQDISLSWICDGNLLPLKFLNAWMGLIFNDADGDGRFSTTRLSYPDTYMCKKMTILKGERNESGTLSRNPRQYEFYNVWPYSVQSTPLSYGSSQLLSVSASFYYRKWKFI
jgi:hypothetical protein